MQTPFSWRWRGQGEYEKILQSSPPTPTTPPAKKCFELPIWPSLAMQVDQQFSTRNCSSQSKYHWIRENCQYIGNWIRSQAKDSPTIFFVPFILSGQPNMHNISLNHWPIFANFFILHQTHVSLSIWCEWALSNHNVLIHQLTQENTSKMKPFNSSWYWTKAQIRLLLTASRRLHVLDYPSSSLGITTKINKEGERTMIVLSCSCNLSPRSNQKLRKSPASANYN